MNIEISVENRSKTTDTGSLDERKILDERDIPRLSEDKASPEVSYVTE